MMNKPTASLTGFDHSRGAWRRAVCRGLLIGAGVAIQPLAMSGCAQPRGTIFEPLATPVLWPQPPEPARIRYVGEILTDTDLKPAQSGFEVIESALFGSKPHNSMLTPFAVSSDSSGRVFVCDSNAQVVHVFDLETRRYARWAPGEGATPFAQPTGIASDGRSNLYVADPVAGVVFVFDADGTVVREFGVGVLSRPVGLAFDPVGGRLFVADTGAHRVFVFSPGGELLQAIGERGSEDGDFNFPTNVAVDSLGRLYVSDSLNFRVQMFDAGLNFIRQIGSEGDIQGYFSQPKGIALDSDDHLYVVDARFESVQLFDTDGALLLSFGEEGRGPGQFWLPAGIHIDSQDRIWVADTYNRRIQVFEYLPEPVESAP